jgi:hypothetical protein
MAAKLKDILTAQVESLYELYRINIENARQEFRDKEFKKCLELYLTVEDQTLFSELDNKLIKYCKLMVDNERTVLSQFFLPSKLPQESF